MCGLSELCVRTPSRLPAACVICTDLHQGIRDSGKLYASRACLVFPVPLVPFCLFYFSFYIARGPPSAVFPTTYRTPEWWEGCAFLCLSRTQKEKEVKRKEKKNASSTTRCRRRRQKSPLTSPRHQLPVGPLCRVGRSSSKPRVSFCGYQGRVPLFDDRDDVVVHSLP